MRYFSYDDPEGTHTLSEEEIRVQFYPTWYNRMCEKFGKDNVNAIYRFEDCLEDWKVVNHGREVDI